MTKTSPGHMDPLGRAILDGRVSDVRTLVKRDPSSLDLFSPSGSTMLRLAEDKGVVETIVVLLYANSPGAESYDDYEALLHAYVMETSESWTSTGWESGIEFTIWSLVVGDRASHQFSEHHNPFSLGPEEKDEWLFLAEKAGGWPTFEEFLSLESWKMRYEEFSR